MKFIPSENKRFLLEERFVLNEDVLLEAGATPQELVRAIKELNALLPRILQALPIGSSLSIPDNVNLRGDKAQIEQQIKKECETVQNLLQGQKNFGEVLKQMAGKAASQSPYSQDELIKIVPVCQQLKTMMSSIISTMSNLKRNNGALAKQIQNLYNTLPELTKNINSLYGAVTPKAVTKYKLKQSRLDLKVGDTYNVASLIEATPKPASKIDATFEVVTVVNKDKDDKDKAIATLSPQGMLKAIAEGKALIKITIGDQTLKCSCQIEANNEISTKGTDKTDWKIKLASAGNKETVIEEFIYTTWPTQAKEVIKIKAALLRECEQYGFLNSGEHQNPFITFISEVYLDPSYHMQPQTYNVIHNLVADNVLSGKDITGTGVMTKGNLVFCKALYRLEPGAIKMYVKKQHNILQAATKPDMFASNAELAFNILYAVSQVQSGRATKFSTEMQLRSIAQIEQLEKKWTGTVSNTAEDSTTKTKPAELLKQIKDTTAATKLLVALAIKFSSNEKLTTLVQAYDKTRQFMAKNTTPIELQKLVASVENLYKITNITAAQALSLSKSVVESDQFEFTKE